MPIFINCFVSFEFAKTHSKSNYEVEVNARRLSAVFWRTLKKEALSDLKDQITTSCVTVRVQFRMSCYFSFDGEVFHERKWVTRSDTSLIIGIEGFVLGSGSVHSSPN